jgi:hypothetical protein
MAAPGTSNHAGGQGTRGRALATPSPTPPMAFLRPICIALAMTSPSESPLERLRPWFPFLTLLSPIVAVVLYLLSGHRYDLSTELLAVSHVVDVGPERPAGLAVALNGRSIETLDSVSVRVSNSGNAPLRSTDFEEPLLFEYGPDAEVVSAAIADALPLGLDPRVGTEGGKVRIQPLLLNPGDRFTLNALVTGRWNGPIFLARVAGVNPSGPVEPRVSLPLADAELAFIFLILYFYIAFVAVNGGIRAFTLLPVEALCIALVAAIACGISALHASHEYGIAPSRPTVLGLVALGLAIAGVLFWTRQSIVRWMGRGTPTT